MKIYRALDRPYQDPRGFEEEKLELIEEERRLRQDRDLMDDPPRLYVPETMGYDRFTRLFELKRFHRLGHFASDMEAVIEKHGSPEGCLLTIDADEALLAGWVLANLDIRYGSVYGIPDTAALEPAVKLFRNQPELAKLFL
ncbi:MAG: hypothetical protein ABH879_09395 [archaeon]